MRILTGTSGYSYKQWKGPFYPETLPDAEMHRTFNCGIGMVVLLPAAQADAAVAQLNEAGERAAVIGEVAAGAGVRIG